MNYDQHMTVSSVRNHDDDDTTRHDTNIFMLVGYSNVVMINLALEAQVLDGASCCVLGLIASTFHFARNK
jgi:hypothetical protein